MDERQTREIYRNTIRDEATTGRSGLRFDQKPGFADEDQPITRPPESEPEPRPPEPTGTADHSAPFEQ